MYKEQSEFSPLISSHIEATILNYKSEIEADPQKGVGMVGELAGLFSRVFEINPLQRMQNVFTKHSMDIKLLAIPKGSRLDEYGFVRFETGQTIQYVSTEYTVGLPHDPDGDYPYYMNVILQRTPEFYDKIRQLHVTPEENFVRLAQTGMLRIRPRN